MTTGHNVHLLPQKNQLRAIHTIIRDKDCTREDFVFHSRRVIRQLLEAGLDLLPFTKKDVTTPVGTTYHGLEFASKICAVPVIRAGDAMEGELRHLHPGIRVGKILIQRDKRTKLPHLYYQHLPADIADGHVLLLEPTGSSPSTCTPTRSSASSTARWIISSPCPPSPTTSRRGPTGNA
ncbi:uracil phosphoribosyltransferase [Streptomyces canus]